jgi:phosphoribosyl 1,2-cyclic phosphodiesterase
MYYVCKMSKKGLSLKFWGVRGSIATPEAENLGIGGNTACVEVRGPSGEILVFDAGTGIRRLGRELQREFSDQAISLRLFLSHFHWDHVQGFPFFEPLFDPATSITIFGPSFSSTSREALGHVMSSPYFPIDYSAVQAELDWVDVRDEVIACGTDVTVRPFELHHPQRALGYRIESGSASIVYASDFEHGDERLDRLVRESCRGASVLIFDAQYTCDQYEDFRGWGHSTFCEATDIARECEGGRLILFHHDPDRDDAALASIEEQAQSRFPKTYVAREGDSFQIEG